MVVYVVVVLWMVSANFRSSVSSVAGNGNSFARNVIRKVVNHQAPPPSCISSDQLFNNCSEEDGDEEEEELEALLVVRDRGKGLPDISTNLDHEETDGDLV